ncbi:MAG: type II toxin-antitoxin system PemK/MazF family toxin [Candidatus Marinimicrobia bacterium]|nr:type II toxin-antitoxin system PemK/MazF family toxin [Candidatus Neomarinimicrobiota bacterium]
MNQQINKWDIVLISINKNNQQIKRPALIVSPNEYNREGYSVIFPITSNISSISNIDYKINFWKEAGLPKSAIVKLWFATISNSIITKKIGTLHQEDIFNILKLL